MKVKFKKLNSDAVIPSYAIVGDAGLDLTSTSRTIESDYVEYGTGLAVEIPEGYVGLIFPRSSVTKYRMMLKNSVGIIDSGYRNEIKFRFYSTDPNRSSMYNIGDRIGQMIIMPYPSIEPEECFELSSSDRGLGGYGSTGK
jgi:dUTP pyrophosphatase